MSPVSCLRAYEYAKRLGVTSGGGGLPEDEGMSASARRLMAEPR